MASVLITGASKGIGRAAAAEFARRGHRVIATARDPRTLAGLPADQRLALDVTDPDSITSAVGEAGEVDVLVANAGAIFVAAVEATPAEALARLLEVNTIGALRVAQAVLPGMRARGRGRLLFLSSIAGRIVRPRQAAYAATKWALEALVEALAIEAGPLGIEAALLEPGPVSSGASRPRHRLHPARRSLRPPAHPGRRARRPDDHAGRGRGRDRRRGRGAAAAPAHPHRPARRPDPGRTPGRTRRPPVHPRCIHGRPVVNGEWRLTELLLPLLVAAPAGRIVNVASEYYSRKLDLGNLQGEQKHSYFGAYSASELGKVLFTTELARRIKGSGVTVMSVSPGPARTNFSRPSGVTGLVLGVMQHTPMVKPADQAAGGIS